MSLTEAAAARDVLPGERWAFDDHRSMAETLADVPREVPLQEGVFAFELLPDLLHAMWSDNLLTPDMFGAAVDLRTAFLNAKLDFCWLQEAEPSDVDFIIFGHPRKEFREVACRELVALSLECVGGILSPGGSCLWYVVGWGHPLRHFAELNGYSEDIAVGILIGALSAIGTHLHNPQTATIPQRAVDAAMTVLGLEPEKPLSPRSRLYANGGARKRAEQKSPPAPKGSRSRLYAKE